MSAFMYDAQIQHDDRNGNGVARWRHSAIIWLGDTNEVKNFTKITSLARGLYLSARPKIKFVHLTNKQDLGCRYTHLTQQ
jgi:hypothetical protein